MIVSKIDYQKHVSQINDAFLLYIWHFWNLREDIPGASRNLTANKFAEDLTGLIERARQDCHAYSEDKQKAEEAKAMIVQEIEELQDTVQQKKILQTQGGFKPENYWILVYLLGFLTILKPLLSAR